MKVELELPPDPTVHQLLAALAEADPDPYRRWEVIGDQLYLLPNADNWHQEAANVVSAIPRAIYRRRPSTPKEGWVIIPTPGLKDVLDRDGIKRPKIPDIGGWQAGRYVVNDAGYCPVAPNWVCEILSPSTRSRDKGPKAKDYAALGIEWYWLVDLDAARLDVWRLEGEGYAEHAAHDLRGGFAADPFQEARFAVDDFHFVLNEGR